MLRNSYLETFTQSKKLSEFEKEILAHDEKHLLNLQRPMSSRSIDKLPKNVLRLFIDDIMCNKKINQLLYSSNANKELLLYLKQKQFLLKNTKPYIKRNPFSIKENKRPYESVFLKKKKDAMFKIIKDNISEFKNNKSNSFKILKQKNKNFHKKQIKTNKLFRKLFFKPVNDIRLGGYKKAIEYCLNKSEIKENFDIPDISFNMNDVYSRLYNNVICSPDKLSKDFKKNYTFNYNNKNINLSDISNKNEENNLENTNISKILNQNKRTSKRKNEIINTKAFSSFNKRNTYKNNAIGEYNSYYVNKIKNMPKFNLKKILDGSDGKEFSVKPSVAIYQKCWKKNSGGPNIKKKFYNKIFNKVFYDNFSESNDTKEIVDVNSYRDEDKNNSLIIATKRNNERFVKYFLDKKYNPNEKNKYGNTALHFAMVNNNEKIIKLLMDKGGDITIKNKNGVTPYDMATREIRSKFKLETILLLKGNKNYNF